MLPLYKHYVEGNVPGEDFLWRQYEHFHPIGVPIATEPVLRRLAGVSQRR